MKKTIKRLVRKMYIPVLAAMSIATACTNTQNEQPLEQVINEALNNAVEQSIKMAELYAENDTVLPRSFADGKNVVSDKSWWTSGFFPGTLWYLYEYAQTAELETFAREYSSRIEAEKYTTNNHDIGFMLYCSFGNGYRLKEDTTFREVLLTGAKSLSTRFNPNVGLIRSWDFNKNKWQYPVIIDNMMNLELLLWASNESRDTRFRDIAVSHADKTLEHHYRPDFSCYHVVSYDTISGLPHIKQTHQGFSDESAWARGQAWGLYGYTLMYRETKDEKYLDQANQIAAFMINHPNMPEDFIPYWDFNAPAIPDEPRDASTAALMASALIELSDYVEKEKSEEYIQVAETQLRTLATPEYTAALGENGNFILKHSVGSKPHDSEIDVPLTYADYYYVEALLRLNTKLEKAN